jgi:hypothetical protein
MAVLLLKRASASRPSDEWNLITHGKIPACFRHHRAGHIDCCTSRLRSVQESEKCL